MVFLCAMGFALRLALARPDGYWYAPMMQTSAGYRMYEIRGDRVILWEFGWGNVAPKGTLLRRSELGTISGSAGTGWRLHGCRDPGGTWMSRLRVRLAAPTRRVRFSGLCLKLHVPRRGLEIETEGDPERILLVPADGYYVGKAMEIDANRLQAREYRR